MRSSYTISLSLSVSDASALWSAAAAVAMASPGMTMASVIETIGPQADAEIESCLTLLVIAGSPPGCLIQSLACKPLALVQETHPDVISIGGKSRPVRRLAAI